jgi:poly(hydroxyalkanoate) depolymerase family esterase
MRFLLVIVSIFSALACAQGQVPLKKISNFGANPGNLTMYLHRPCHPVDTVKYRRHKPLVVVLHGCNQDAISIARQSGWNKLSDNHDFYVVYAEQKRINNASDCFNWFNETDITPNSGESGSVRQMIQFMYDSLRIDTTQIFIYGLSAGGAMTSVMMANYPGLINAAAIFAGAPYKLATGPGEALSAMLNARTKSLKEWGELVLKDNPDFKGRYPRLILVHGVRDKIVNPKNSQSLIKQWSYVLRTDTVAAETKSNFAGNPDVTKHTYFTQKKEAKIFYYEIAKLGHALSVDPGEGEMQGGETGLFSADKNFFSTYWIARDFGLVE